MSDDLIYRLRKRAEIRRNIPTRKSVQNNEPDRIADLLDEAANAIEELFTSQLDAALDDLVDEVNRGTMNWAQNEIDDTRALVRKYEKRNVELQDKIKKLRAQVKDQEEKINKLLDHCPDPECWECGKIMCPYGGEMHFHHDGCPTCAEMEYENANINKT
jgi:chromosome segregation ATPase